MTDTSKIKTMKPEDLPPPETLIEYKSGQLSALMFHYALEHHLVTEIASEHGFDLKGRVLDEDDDADLYRRYIDDGDDVVGDWNPTPPDGWLLVGKWDTEDGPIAWFAKRRIDASPSSSKGSEG